MLLLGTQSISSYAAILLSFSQLIISYEHHGDTWATKKKIYPVPFYWLIANRVSRIPIGIPSLAQSTLDFFHGSLPERAACCPVAPRLFRWPWQTHQYNLVVPRSSTSRGNKKTCGLTLHKCGIVNVVPNGEAKEKSDSGETQNQETYTYNLSVDKCLDTIFQSIVFFSNNVET